VEITTHVFDFARRISIETSVPDTKVKKIVDTMQHNLTRWNYQRKIFLYDVESHDID